MTTDGTENNKANHSATNATTSTTSIQQLRKEAKQGFAPQAAASQIPSSPTQSPRRRLPASGRSIRSRRLSADASSSPHKTSGGASRDPYTMGYGGSRSGGTRARRASNGGGGDVAMPLPQINLEEDATGNHTTSRPPKTTRAPSTGRTVRAVSRRRRSLEHDASSSSSSKPTLARAPSARRGGLRRNGSVTHMEPQAPEVAAKTRRSSLDNAVGVVSQGGFQF
eukprot:CAMPEP_0172471566 /NCGR_PEP_ID=MMETSP1065-20121228/67885_1 /TAXON_ID=265537 /ORGANISM="Amphiprora paludosa, Strain CCMP125" /LENGTH=223 /DNA_ID=CAMNT_0013229669 /DNA_START=274 /DNA_END=945 /DNA_ORIENTATION=+